MNSQSDPNSANSPAPSKELRRLIDGLLADTLTRPEFARLEEILEQDAAARRYYFEIVGNETLLPEVLEDAKSRPSPVDTTGLRYSMTRKPWAIGMAAAAAVLLIAVTWHLLDLGISRDPSLAGPSLAPVVARLESESQASWGLNSPGGVGAPIRAGIFDLKSGIAEFRFNSGARLALEAPARMEIIDEMRCRLHWGTSVLDVPESAIGFIVDTPEGRAVDHGTRFAVQVDPLAGSSVFEVLEGKISIHHQKSGAMAPLGETQAARMTHNAIESLDTPPSRIVDDSLNPEVLRVRTEGREACVVRDPRPDYRKELLDPNLLMVKRDREQTSAEDTLGTGHPSDRRSLIGFRLGDVNAGQTEEARLLLNLVPTGLGFASSLPETSTFEVYGVRDQAALESWSGSELRWDQAPGAMDWEQGIDASEVRLLGRFDIPKGMVSGPIHFESPELLDFIKGDTTGEVHFLLVRATPPLESWSMVHAFASSSHPTSAGPSLELKAVK